MLINAAAGFNIEQAVITNDPVKTLNTTLIQYHRKGSLDIFEFAGLAISQPSYSIYY